MTQAFRAAPKRRTLATALVTALASMAMLALVLAPAAGAASDPVKSGTFKLKLAKSFKNQLKANHVKLKPKKPNLSITSGTVDPTTGAANLTLKGKLTFKGNGHKYVVKSLTATLPGNLKGKAKGKKVTVAKLKGGTVARNGFGATISGVKAKFKAANKVNKALDLHSLKNKTMGEATVDEQPSTVTATGGQLNLQFNATPPPAPGLPTKLLHHCINPGPGQGGIAPINGAIVVTPITLGFPVTGGTIAPDATAGQVDSSGGIRITKNIDGPNGLGDNCPVTGPYSADLDQPRLDFETKQASVIATLPQVGNVGRNNVLLIDTAGSTVTADSNAKTITVSDIAATLNGAVAPTLNTVFPNASSDPAQDFAGGDPVGTATITVNTQ